MEIIMKHLSGVFVETPVCGENSVGLQTVAVFPSKTKWAFQMKAHLVRQFIPVCQSILKISGAFGFF